MMMNPQNSGYSKPPPGRFQPKPIGQCAMNTTISNWMPTATAKRRVNSPSMMQTAPTVSKKNTA